MFDFSGTACQIGEFQMREGLEYRRHYLGWLPIAENLTSDFKSCLCPIARQIKHLSFAVSMVLDDLVRAMSMVVINASMSR